MSKDGGWCAGNCSSAENSAASAPRFVYEALINPDRDAARPWLTLDDDKQRPTIAEAVDPSLVVWTSIWPWRPDARIRFDISGRPRGSATLCWTLLVDEPAPDEETVILMRKRINKLINANLRFTFGQ